MWTQQRTTTKPSWSVLRQSRCCTCRNSIEPPQRCCAIAIRQRMLSKRHTYALGKHFPGSLPAQTAVPGFSKFCFARSRTIEETGSNRFQFCGPEALDGMIYKAPKSEDLTDEEILSGLKNLPAR